MVDGKPQWHLNSAVSGASHGSDQPPKAHPPHTPKDPAAQGQRGAPMIPTSPQRVIPGKLQPMGQRTSVTTSQHNRVPITPQTEVSYTSRGWGSVWGAGEGNSRISQDLLWDLLYAELS